MKPGIKVPLEVYEPVDDAEHAKRARCFSHAVQKFCERQVESILQRCEAGEFGETTQEIAADEISEWSIASGAKLFTCINLHLTGLEQSQDDGPPWLIDFLFEALRDSDDIHPSPGAAEVIREHGSWKVRKILNDTATHLCALLGLPRENDQLTEAVVGLIADSAENRSELLLFALTQPIESLGDKTEPSI